MLEDMLAYPSGSLLNPALSELLAADLDDDARHFYARAKSDIRIVARAVGRASHRAPIEQSLLEALVAAPAARPGCWRRLYRRLAVLVGGYAAAAVEAEDRPKLERAVGRLRGFLAENVDIADALAIEQLERALSPGAGA
jgi:hypothetical protein